MNIAEIEMQLSELVRQPFDQSEFVFNFMEIFNAPKASITKLRNGTQNKADLVGDVLWQRKLYYRAAEPGQAALTVDALRQRKPAKTNKPRFIIATDGRDFSAFDTKADETLHCDFASLNDHFDFFLPLAGIDKYEAVEENPADIKATGRLAKLHDEIVRQNPDWTTDEKRHALNQFMTRILFCLFAEDTGSFPKDLFVKTITEFGGDDGQHLQVLLKRVFDVMNVPDNERGDVPAHIRAFPYVNGGLFADSMNVPAFNRRARRILIEAAQLNWSEINPDIFGSMIQAIVHPDMRGDLGMHYTSVPNIMKVLQPLFLMSLEEEFAEAHGHREERSRLTKLLMRISKMRVFDPACGSGNFLIIAYRELRTLEMRIFKRIEELEGGQRSRHWTGVKLSNFYGIELADFAAETAKLSLWIAEYQMNQRFKDQFGEAPPNFPLTDGGHIICGNALRRDWLEVCPPPMKTRQKQKVFDLATVVPVRSSEVVPDDEAETYIVGNPPYLGSGFLTESQKLDADLLFEGKLDRYKSLDYVAGWYMKAATYIHYIKASCAFVSTNSICQGEQTSVLWPYLLSQGLEIGFAHRSFWWSNNAANNAAVSCIAVCIRRKQDTPKYIFEGDLRRRVANIGPYLLEMPTIVVRPAAAALSPRPTMIKGSQATDDGNLILTREQKEELVLQYPESLMLIRKFYGSQELSKGIDRWCLWIENGNLDLANSIPAIKHRIERIREFRLASSKAATRAFAAEPHRFTEIRFREADAIVVPKSTSERRQYITAVFVEAGAVISDQAFAMYDAPPMYFGVISSRLHYIWGATVGGRFKLDPRYSNTLVFNTFPLPHFSSDDAKALEEASWNVVQERERSPGKTLSWLYDPDTMPDGLLDAHNALDAILERTYIGRPFRSDTERLEHLFKLYAEMTSATEREAASV